MYKCIIKVKYIFIEINYDVLNSILLIYCIFVINRYGVILWVFYKKN